MVSKSIQHNLRVYAIIHAIDKLYDPSKYICVIHDILYRILKKYVLYNLLKKILHFVIKKILVLLIQ